MVNKAVSQDVHSMGRWAQGTVHECDRAGSSCSAVEVGNNQTVFLCQMYPKQGCHMRIIFIFMYRWTSCVRARRLEKGRKNLERGQKARYPLKKTKYWSQWRAFVEDTNSRKRMLGCNDDQLNEYLPKQDFFTMVLFISVVVRWIGNTFLEDILLAVKLANR